MDTIFELDLTQEELDELYQSDAHADALEALAAFKIEPNDPADIDEARRLLRQTARNFADIADRLELASRRN
jgi:hypothetical protein